MTEGDADLVFIGRELLREPYWALKAQHEFGAEPAWPTPYGYAVKHSPVVVGYLVVRASSPSLATAKNLNSFCCGKSSVAFRSAKVARNSRCFRGAKGDIYCLTAPRVCAANLQQRAVRVQRMRTHQLPLAVLRFFPRRGPRPRSFLTVAAGVCR